MLCIILLNHNLLLQVEVHIISLHTHTHTPTHQFTSDLWFTELICAPEVSIHYVVSIHICIYIKYAYMHVCEIYMKYCVIFNNITTVIKIIYHCQLTADKEVRTDGEIL